ncbi:YceI family protein [Rhodohalobacter mucosus]|uniref:Polyisoprenoid-binding protein n=1 Tax=Rhodohalobacter mucosus TaxID=2079485 RepID=A0A316TM38_9BACT|nr:YceI family protein [Rhodohalobacter mucosus]PWN05647.1 polyisoprenoid-binding protein [Rhodohalobacter mucosus]
MYNTIIRTTLLAITFLFAAAYTTVDNKTADATSWEIDKAHSAINFTINHFFTPVDGTFRDYSATVNFDPANLEESRIDVTIPVSGIDTRNERRDNHLMSEDFFNAAQWPNIRFVSSEIVEDGEGGFIAKGEMTIRDITRDFELPFELLGVMDHPMQENTRVAGIRASAELMRNDYGVGTGDWAATAVVGNQVNIQLNLELTTAI